MARLSGFGFAAAAGLAWLVGCGNPVVGHGCPADATLCGTSCVDLWTDHDNCGACGHTCTDDQTCSGGSCRGVICDLGEIPCDGVCIDPRTDAAHCGACRHACPAGRSCSSGICAADCTAPLSACGEMCVDLATDEAHCGDCDIACAPGQECLAGSCVGEICDAPLVGCAGVCVDLRTDPANCGACRHACAPTELCQRGSCVLECLPGYVACGGCGNACAPAEVCEAGECRTSCLPGQVDCNGACVDVTRDPDNCGACGVACALDVPCVDGVCHAPCPTGVTDCGGTCVDLSSDPFNCGTCGNVCDPGDVCRSSTCVLDCPTGRTGCGEECVDLATDPAHCGRCDRACLPTESCFAGTCLLVCPDGFTACSGSCADLTSDPDNCGMCGRTCTSGICELSACSEAVPGHVVLVGHNFARFRRAQLLVVANAVFSWAAANPVRVAALTAWAPTGSGTAANNVDLALSQAALERGRTWERTPFTDVAALAAALESSDVLLIYEQSLAADTALRAAGTSLAAPLDTFLRRGGVVLVTDARTANNGTWQLLDSAGLIAATGCTDITGARISVVSPGDAIASSVPLNYVAERNSVRFDSTETTQVVGDGTGPVVIHKVITP
jgi:hypothetical protein